MAMHAQPGSHYSRPDVLSVRALSHLIGVVRAGSAGGTGESFDGDGDVGAGPASVAGVVAGGAGVVPTGSVPLGLSPGPRPVSNQQPVDNAEKAMRGTMARADERMGTSKVCGRSNSWRCANRCGARMAWHGS